MDAWLRQLGLPQYIPAFKAAGYDDLATLAHLNRADLKCVEEVTGWCAQRCNHRTGGMASCGSLWL